MRYASCARAGPTLQKQNIIGVLWQIQGEEGEEAELYVPSSPVRIITSHSKNTLIYKSSGIFLTILLLLLFLTEIVWTRREPSQLDGPEVSTKEI